MANGDTYKDKPWEDTLILAFRDMQWIRKIMHSTDETREDLAQPPSLMAKLDGNAESAAGDILAGYRKRFFLFEFKSSGSLFYTEERKSVYTLLSTLEYSTQGTLIDFSERGHFLVYPDIKEGRSQASPSILPVHWVDLMGVPYYFMTNKDHHAKLKERSEKLEDIFYREGGGLSLEEIALYLQALARANEKSDGGGAPFKAVIASPDGMLWPIGELSDFMNFVISAEPYLLSKSRVETFNEVMAQIEQSFGNKKSKTDWGDDFTPR